MTDETAQTSVAEGLDRTALRRFLLSRTRDPALADDLVQDVVVRLIEYAGRQAVHNPGALAFRIAENLVRDHFRRPRNRGHDALSEELLDAAPSAERVVMDRQRLAFTLSVIHRMPAKRREVLTRRRLEGQSLEEIADGMKLSPAAVEKHLTRAFQMLREALEVELRRERRRLGADGRGS